VAGKSINDKKINFKFFKGNGWDGEYSATTLSCSSPDVFVGNGSTPDYLGNNVDSGNLGLLRPLEAGATYVFVVDVSGGMNNSVLTVTKVE
jgi:hypothetical protein